VTIDMPDFTVPADEQQTVECPVEGLTAPATPVVYDHCGTLIEPTLVSSPTTVECEGPMVWVYNYTDCAGSSHDWTFTYLIEMPPFIPPSDDGETVDCPADGLVAPATPVVYDLCGNPVNADLVTAPPAIPCEGTMVWVYNYTDCAGNSADWSYTYTIVYLPFAAIPPTTDITDCYQNIALPAPPTVYDNCGVALFPTGPIEGTIPPCEGDISYTWTYTDCAGNTQQYVHTVTIEYEPFAAIPPTTDITDCYQNIVLPTPPTVYDNCGVALFPTGPIEGTIPPCEGNISYTWTYTDCEVTSQPYVHTVTI